MIQFLHRILAFILSLIVLFSTLSFSVEKHICMGEVTDVSYFNNVKSCGMIEDECKNEDFKYNSINKVNCCDNIHELIQGNQTQQQAIDNFEIKQLQFIIAYSYSYIDLFEERKDLTPFIYYPPPQVNRNIQVLYQTFLI